MVEKVIKKDDYTKEYLYLCFHVTGNFLVVLFEKNLHNYHFCLKFTNNSVVVCDMLL